jgi:hypothetical protein
MSKIPGSQVRIVSYQPGVVALGSNAAILADTALDDEDDTVVTSFVAQPDVPRNLTVKGNDGNVTGDVIITGTNIAGGPISETIALNGSTAVVGSKAFKTVTSITLPPYDTANTERIRVGTGAKLGLPHALSRNTVLAAYLANVREATAPTVAVSAAVIESNTATLNSALAGTAVVIDLYETV